MHARHVIEWAKKHVRLQAVVWTGAAILSVLIVASRKHYTVDVLIAWYVVPLVFYASHRRWTTKRTGKDEWPHRPLPEEQPPDLESGLANTAAEARFLPAILNLPQTEGSHASTPQCGMQSIMDMPFT